MTEKLHLETPWPVDSRTVLESGPQGITDLDSLIRTLHMAQDWLGTNNTPLIGEVRHAMWKVLMMLHTTTRTFTAMYSLDNDDRCNSLRDLSQEQNENALRNLKEIIHKIIENQVPQGSVGRVARESLAEIEQTLHRLETMRRNQTPELAKFHVFISYNSKDLDTITELAKLLQEKGINVWFDHWAVPPGSKPQDKISEALRTIECAAVFIGANDLGKWQKQEVDICIRQANDREMPIIPVFLPDLPREYELPEFLSNFSWVDLRRVSIDEGIERLRWGITKVNPYSTSM